MNRIEIPAPLNGKPCAGRELLAGEVAALKLDTRCRWLECTTGEHPPHKLCSKGKSA